MERRRRRDAMRMQNCHFVTATWECVSAIPSWTRKGSGSQPESVSGRSCPLVISVLEALLHQMGRDRVAAIAIRLLMQGVHSMTDTMRE